MIARLKERFPSLFLDHHLSTWLTIQAQLGLAPATLDAYARDLLDYVAFCQAHSIVLLAAEREHIAAYVHDLAVRPLGKGPIPTRYGYANATMHRHIVAVRLFYDHLKEEGIREYNPVKRGFYTPGKGFGGSRRGLLPHFKKLPWIPTETEWQALLVSALDEPIRNRLMLALSYDAGLRRGELCSLHTSDIDPAYRLITLRADVTKGHRARVVPYSAATSQLYVAYLQQRRYMTMDKRQTFLFLSESRRNKNSPITYWSWSKTMLRIARRAGLPQFTPHTLRHLCLTDLARAGWDLHEIATFAGHQSLDTTLMYIHLSGRELSNKLAQGMKSIHTWRTQTIESMIR